MKNAPIHETFVDSQSANIYVRTAGNPEANEVLITLHGGPGLSHRYLRDLEQLATSDLLVVSYDQRASGLSSRSAQPENDFAPSTYVQDLDAVRQAVAGQKRVHLLGHSWGGYVAMVYAITHPEYVGSLLFVDSVPPTTADLQAGMQRCQQRVQELQQKGIIAKELSTTDKLEYLQQILPAYVYSPEMLSGIPGNTFEINPEAEPKTWNAIGNYDLREQLTRITPPVLILFGANDPFGTSWAEATRDAFLHAKTTLEIIPQCGHFPWVEQSETFYRSVHDFLHQELNLSVKGVCQFSG
ncbi:MAG TPA: alpha/beta hydrolase [Ktedonobacteraceae bacterium]|nr:alpha/beta hydrolase [Ktedonobacteraceae bacterium]